MGQIPLFYNHKNTGRPLLGDKFEKFRSNYLDVPNTPLYPFGYGLSYTSFEYSNMKIEKRGQYDFDVTVDVKNTGERDGDDVVQLYIDDVASSVVTPPLLLKGFERVSLKAGETKTVSFSLTKSSFELMDIKYRKVVEPGDFRILIAKSSRDVKLEETIHID